MAVESIESLEVVDHKSANGAASSKILASANDWCYKCKKFYQACKEVAAKNDIQVVDGLFSSKITLKCSRRGHQFKISYSKKLQTLTCSDCRREEREEWKEQIRQEEIKKNEFYLRQQRELFEQARREMEHENHRGGDHHQGWSSSVPSSSSQPNLSYYARLEEQINIKA